MYDCEKDFKDSSWGVGVQTDVRCNSGARWGRVLWAAGSSTTSSPNRRTDESGTRNRTPELSSCPSLTLPLPCSFIAVSSSPPDPSPANGTYRIAPSLPALDTELGVRTALAEEGWLCTNSPMWEAHFRTLSSSTLLARAALHLVEHLRTRSHPSEESIARSWRITSGPRSKVQSRSPRARK